MAGITLRNLQLKPHWDNKKGRFILRSSHTHRVGGVGVTLLAASSMSWAIDHAGDDFLVGSVLAAVFGALLFVLGIVIAFSKSQIVFDPYSKHYEAQHQIAGSAIQLGGDYEELRSLELVHEVRRANVSDQTGMSVLACYLNWRDGGRWELFAIPDGGPKAEAAAIQAEKWAQQTGLMLIIKPRTVEVVFRTAKTSASPSRAVEVTNCSELVIRKGIHVEVFAFEGRNLRFGSSQFDIFEIESIYVAKGNAGVVVESPTLIARLGEFLSNDDQNWITTWLIDRLQESREAAA